MKCRLYRIKGAAGRRYARPWVLRRGPKVLAAFPTGAQALEFLRAYDSWRAAA